MKSCVRRLVLRQRETKTRKWAIWPKNSATGCTQTMTTLYYPTNDDTAQFSDFEHVYFKIILLSLFAINVCKHQS